MKRSLRRMMLRNERFAIGTTENFDPELIVGPPGSRFRLERKEAAKLLAWLRDAVPWMDSVEAENLKAMKLADREAGSE